VPLLPASSQERSNLRETHCLGKLHSRHERMLGVRQNFEKRADCSDFS